MRQDEIEEKRWLARLTECKRKDLKQLQRRAELRPVNNALDKLLPFNGFWPALQIGTFHHFVEEQMYQNNLFPKISDVTTRSQILQKLLKTSCLIPSLFTFFEDTKWLEPIAKVVRKLLPGSCKKSNRHAMYQKYTSLRAGVVHIKDRDQWRTEAGEATHHMECGYLQLYMFAWRHFPELIGAAPRKDKGTPKPQIQQINKHSWRRLGQLAKDLGFDSKEISGFANSNPDLGMALAFLNQTRPPDFYNQTKDRYHASALQICHVLDEIEEQGGLGHYKHLDHQMDHVPLEYRYGRPFEKSFEYGRSNFFLSDIYSAANQRLSYFAVNKNIFFAFFGFELRHRMKVHQHQATSNTVDADHLMTGTRENVDISNSNEVQGLESELVISNQDNQYQPADVHSHTSGPAMPIVQSGNDRIENLFDDDQRESDTMAGVSPKTPEQTHGSTAANAAQNPHDLLPNHQEGGWLLVDADYAIGLQFPKENRKEMESHIYRQANNYFFACYSDSENRLIAQRAEDIYRFSKGGDWDGIIYFFKSDRQKLKNLTDIGFETFRGPTMEDRLRQLSERYKNKRKNSKEPRGLDERSKKQKSRGEEFEEEL
ncbi:MAG: hypothetical protein Q9190_004942 [Brigantiaea leucoxantha]